jgi:YbbR domain-containing protein
MADRNLTKNTAQGTRRKKNDIFANWALKLLAVVLGFLVWLVVLNINDSAVTKRITGINVELINTEAITSQNQLFTITSGESVDIVIKGRKSLISDLDASDFTAVADMSKLSITNAAPITVTANSQTISKKVTITVVDNVLSVELEEEKTVSIPVSVETSGEVAEGYTVGNSVATPNLITISGAASVVSSIDRARVTVNVNDAKEDITTNCEPVFVTADGEEISDKTITYKEESISVTVPVYKTKSVPIKIDVKGKPAEGYVVSDITYVPENIDIGGESTDVSKISSLEIDDVDISGCTEDFEVTLDVTKYLPEGVVVTKESAYINVKVAIEKAVTRSITLNTSDITIENEADDLNYEIELDEASVTVSGVSSEVSKVSSKSLKVSIDAANLVYGENHVTLNIPEQAGITVSKEYTATVTVSSK